MTRLLILLAALSPTLLYAHGFDVRNVGNVITAENNDPPYTSASLFGHALDIPNLTLNRNQVDHGSIDADRPGSGFVIPGDVLQMEFLGPLWYSTGGAAVVAPAGVVLTAEQKVTSATRTISASGPASGPLTLAATSSHELIWSLPIGVAEGAYGLSYRITGTSAAGQSFTPSDPLVLVLTTPGYTGDVAAAEQAIFATAVPEPGALTLLAVACAVLGLRLKRASG